MSFQILLEGESIRKIFILNRIIYKYRNLRGIFRGVSITKLNKVLRGKIKKSEKK